MLKQAQFEPLPFTKQVLIIYAGTNGFLDDLAVEECRPFEKALYTYVDTDQSRPVEGASRKRRRSTTRSRPTLVKTIKDAKERFLAERSSGSEQVSQAGNRQTERMANVLDIRRRIRSVRNTRQITKAMKMVSAAKLRRAQERALAARPYAQMLTNVLRSLVSARGHLRPGHRTRQSIRCWRIAREKQASC